MTWTVSAASVKQVGTVFIALRGSDDFGTVKWATNQGYLYVGDTINTPDGAEMALSELEKLENGLTRRLNQWMLRKVAEWKQKRSARKMNRLG